MAEGTVKTAGRRPCRCWRFQQVTVGDGLSPCVEPSVFCHPVVARETDGGICRVGVGVRVLDKIKASAVPGIVWHPFRVEVALGRLHAPFPGGEGGSPEIPSVTDLACRESGHGARRQLDLSGMVHGKVVPRLVNDP